MTQGARVWVLLGHRTGDNNQLLRLASELGLPFRAITLKYNVLRQLPVRMLGSGLASLTRESRAQIRPPWPELVLGIGNRSVPAARRIRDLSNGRTRIVRLGNPRAAPANFDLVITTAQYDVPDSPNVLRLPFGIGTAPLIEPTCEETDWLSRLPRPHRLLLIGGETFMWKVRPSAVAEAASMLRDKSGGSVIAVSSGRTNAKVREAVMKALRGSEHALVWGRFPRYPVLLHDADEIAVTADSVAMISDAVSTTRPVGLVLPERSAAGRVFYSLARAGLPVPIRDVRRFWMSMQSLGLVGSVVNPRHGKLVDDPLDMAVSAIRKLLEN